MAINMVIHFLDQSFGLPSQQRQHMRNRVLRLRVTVELRLF